MKAHSTVNFGRTHRSLKGFSLTVKPLCGCRVPPIDTHRPAPRHWDNRECHSPHRNLTQVSAQRGVARIRTFNLLIKKVKDGSTRPIHVANDFIQHCFLKVSLSYLWQNHYFLCRLNLRKQWRLQWWRLFGERTSSRRKQTAADINFFTWTLEVTTTMAWIFPNTFGHRWS